eukprot:TRINITY_DN97228_c0_g1_i1.p1 TRINITY_DN97228_c0_g1~~TRINITY_DN97228_c0_g1_i1.p1  ORF type:complete len:218 (+),score=46.75 TRINITY_DN97228_c0_g1_i1:85-654(+)
MENESRRKLKLCYIIALVVLLVLTMARFKVLRDAHGALLMALIDLFAIIGIVFDNDYDMQCCKNCGIMAFIGAALDISIAVETFCKADGRDLSWSAKVAFDSPLAVFVIHLLYANVEFLWALLCYFVCQTAEEELWESPEGMLIATQDEARIYGAALQWTERRHGTSSTPLSSAKEAAESFHGRSQKLP